MCYLCPFRLCPGVYNSCDCASDGGPRDDVCNAIRYGHADLLCCTGARVCHNPRNGDCPYDDYGADDDHCSSHDRNSTCYNPRGVLALMA